MTVQIAMFLLTITAAMTSLITEAVKKTITDKKPTITAAIVSVATGIFVPLAYLGINQIPFRTQDIFYIIGMVVLTWVCACTGYDKVIEIINQLINKGKNRMKIMLGSARSDENGKYSGGAPGDQRQTATPDTSGEVSMQDWYVHKKGWIILRAKDPEHSEKIADNMCRACNNPRIGYSQSDRYSVVKYGTATTKNCNCDCSSLVRECVKEATSKDPGDFNTANEANALLRTGMFAQIHYTDNTPVFRGDIVVTQTKGHTAIVTAGPSRLTTTTQPAPRQFGIDVAKWQGVIDWNKVKTSGNGDFAVLKVTKKDNSVEDSFERNYQGTKAACIPIAVYRYVYAKSVGQAVIEANGIVSALKDHRIEGEVWLDMEDSSLRNIGKAALTLLIDTMAGILQAHGYKVGIYCNCDWYDNVLDSADLSTRYKFWIACFGKNTGNGSWKDRADDPHDIAVAWQYTSKGKVPGITGDVDLDALY